MPDESSAADEHAILAEITAPLANLPDDAVPLAADVEFAVVLRGYDRDSVDAYVQRTSRLVAELQATRSPEAAVRRALERVGEQISGVLQRAHDTSEQITTQSRREAEDRLEVARHEALQITAAAQQRLKELDTDTDRIWAERMRIVENARQLARELMTLADTAAEQFPAAQDTGSFEAAATAVVPGEEADFAAEPEPSPSSELEPPGSAEDEPPAAAEVEAPPAEHEPSPRAKRKPSADTSAESPPSPDPDATAVFPPIEPIGPDEPREWPEPKPGS